MPAPGPVVVKDEIRAELSAAEVADGHLLLVSVKSPTQNEISGQFEHIELPFYPVPELGEHEYQAMLGIPFNHAPGPAHVQVHIGKGEAQKTLELAFTVIDGHYKTEILPVNPKFVNPKPADIRRIKRDAHDVGMIYSQSTPIRYWSGPFRLPVKSRITSNFGNKRMFNGEMQSFHQGLDLKAQVGTPIYAPAGGKVVLAKSLFFTGNTVLLDHGQGFYTLYAHLSKFRVRRGQVVKVGKILGLAGKTGRVSGPHLHWGAIVHKAKVNPAELTQVLR